MSADRLIAEVASRQDGVVTRRQLRRPVRGRLRGVLVETDGWATHGYRAAFERDRARDAHLVALGFVVLRFTWRQVVEEPTRVAATVAATLSRGSRARGRSPA